VGVASPCRHRRRLRPRLDGLVRHRDRHLARRGACRRHRPPRLRPQPGGATPRARSRRFPSPPGAGCPSGS